MGDGTPQPTLPEVDLGLSGEDDPRRPRVPEWSAVHPDQPGFEVAEVAIQGELRVPAVPSEFGAFS